MYKQYVSSLYCFFTYQNTLYIMTLFYFCNICIVQLLIITFDNQHLLDKSVLSNKYHDLQRYNQFLSSQFILYFQPDHWTTRPNLCGMYTYRPWLFVSCTIHFLGWKRRAVIILFPCSEFSTYMTLSSSCIALIFVQIMHHTS